MTVATVLVLYAACVGTLGSRMLGRAAWPSRAPLLAIVTYLSAAWSGTETQPWGPSWSTMRSQLPTASRARTRP